MNTRPLIFAAAIGAALLSASAVPAVASNGKASVSYSDLDLSSEAGRAELAKRFDNAALEMCGVSSSEGLRGKQKYCYERSSKHTKIRVAAILEAHDEAKGG